MNISVFGLGHIGCVSAACYASLGHRVMGYDINHKKIAMINRGLSPIFEKDLDQLLREQVKTKHLQATGDIAKALKHADILFICVETPSNRNGEIDLSSVKRVCRQISVLLRDRSSFLTIALRSTILPGMVETQIIPLIEKESGKTAGIDFGFALNPEFLREGVAVNDFMNPPRTVIAANDQRSIALLCEIYQALDTPIFHLSFKEASVLKYADNAFHALKVSFTNEIGRFCKAMGVDSRKVMDAVVQDQKLNLSPTYMKPGFAFGGSCLPKDLRAILRQAQKLDTFLPLIDSIIKSNEEHIQHSYNLIARAGKKHIGILGLSFKEDTDDLRESPIIELVERLVDNGYQVKIFDDIINYALHLDSTREYIQKELTHISTILVDSIQELLCHSELLVLGNKTYKHVEMIRELRNGHQLIDLVDLQNITTRASIEVNYEGICW
jgi:GDP-mannose 6-dehydrogenase